MTNVIKFTTASERSEKEEEEVLYESLDSILDYVEEVAEEGIVIIVRDGKLLSGSTHTNKEILLEMLALAIEEVEGFD